jgi:hypothetical protein
LRVKVSMLGGSGLLKPTAKVKFLADGSIWLLALKLAIWVWDVSISPRYTGIKKLQTDSRYWHKCYCDNSALKSFELIIAVYFQANLFAELVLPFEKLKGAV